MKRRLIGIVCCLSLSTAALAEDSQPADETQPAEQAQPVGEAQRIDDANSEAEIVEAVQLRSEPVPPTDSDRARSYEVDLDLDYLWDGGALPFVYGSGALALGLRLFVTPRTSPTLFPTSEGGEAVFSDTVPEVALGLTAAAGLGIIALTPSVGRWHHAKGYGQALLTTIALTEITKNFVGRQRPTFQVGDTDVDLRRSFFSGHASVTAVTTMYLGLYLNKHILPRVRAPYAPIARLLTYGALGAAYIGVPYSRLQDNRHHLSDVATGMFVGSAFAVGFWAYQETRLLRSEEAFYRKRRSVVVIPDLQNRGLLLTSSW